MSLIEEVCTDPNHVHEWSMIHVELRGEFYMEPLHILDRKVAMLWN